MEKKRIRNPRIFVDTPASLKARYAAACERLGTTMSEDLKAYMERAIEEDTEKARA